MARAIQPTDLVETRIDQLVADLRREMKLAADRQLASQKAIALIGDACRDLRGRAVAQDLTA